MKLKPWVKITLFLFIIIIIFISIKPLFKKDNNINNNKSIYEEYHIPISKQSKTLDYVLNNNIYDEKYLDEYQDINYKEEDYFKDILLSFLPLGYKGKEINYIMSLSSLNRNKLKNKEYIDLSNYYNIKNFNVDNYDRYEEYFKNNNYEYKDVVTYVNLNLDLPVYTNTEEAIDANNNLVLVNKYNSLPADYKPSDLETVKGYYGDQVPMRKETKEAFLNLQKAVKEEKGIELMATTAFRTQARQNALYTDYVAKHGKEKADTFSARPGYSEHQTGLAIDLKNPIRPSGERLNDDDYDWLKNNAHRFGFIVRYKKEKEFITGYDEEDWHIRYVGINEATIIYQENLCLEEYIDLYVKQY